MAAPKTVAVLLVDPAKDPEALEKHWEKTRRMLAENCDVLGSCCSARSTSLPPKKTGPIETKMPKIIFEKNFLTSAKKRTNQLPLVATARMKAWLLRNWDHPYPAEEEKAELSHQLNLSFDQVSNWFINARRRYLVPSVREHAYQRLTSDVMRARALESGHTLPSTAFRVSEKKSAPIETLLSFSDQRPSLATNSASPSPTLDSNQALHQPSIQDLAQASNQVNQPGTLQ